MSPEHPDTPPPDSRFETLFEQSPFSLQLLASDGRTLRVNKAWEALWNVSDGDGLKEWVLGEYNVLTDPQLVEMGVVPLLRRAFAGESVEVPAILYDPVKLSKPGRARWVRAFAHPVRDAGGLVREVMLIHEDVTDRVHAENALRSSEQRLQQLANTIPQLAWMADPEGWIHWYNDRWYDYTGTTPAQMEGWGWQSVHDAEALPTVIARWRASIESGEPFQMTFPLRGRDGRFRPFFTLVAPLKDADGKVVQWFGTNTDVSPLQEAQQALRDNDQRKDEFLAMLAHELRNPLAPIAAAAQLLVMGDASVTARASEVISRQVTHITRLVDDLMDVSRVTRGLIELEREIVDLPSVVQGAVEQAMPQVQAWGHRLATTVEAPSACVEGDRARLVQVVANLLGNAARYTPAGGRIELSLHASEGVATLRVSDNGQGIEARLLPRVFELFTQGERTPDRTGGGLGIGLALVRRLVELHGGQVRAESPGPGKGSVFTVTLPLTATRAPIPSIVQPASPGPAVSRSILVVDDNRDAAESLAALLSATGHRVDVHFDARSALGSPAAGDAEVFILDIGLPDMDGFALARALREHNAGAVFIALTGYGQPVDHAKSEAAGFDHHFVKPADWRALMRAIDGAPGSFPS